MKIKTKLFLVIGVSASVVIIFSIFLYRSFQSFGAAIEKNKIANYISIGVFEKSLLLNEYLLYHGDRQRDQWIARNDSLNVFLKSQSDVFRKDSEKEIVNALLRSIEESRKMFLELVAIWEKSRTGDIDMKTINKEQETGLSAQLLIKAQEKISATKELMAISSEDAVVAQKRISFYLAALIVSIFLLSITVILLLWKSIVDPINKLQKGVKIIGEGNLDYKVEVKSKDEIGQLAFAFNQMTENLKKREEEVLQKTSELNKTKTGIEAEVKKQTEERYGNLFRASQDAIMTLEPPSWKFTSGNPAAIRMFRAKDEAECLSYEPWKLSPEIQPDGRPSGEKAKEMIEKAMKEGTHLFEWMHKRIDGEEFLAEVLLSKVGEGEAAFLLGTVRDISERKKIQNSLEKSNQVMVGRELEMMKLKQRINELEKKAT